MAQALSATRTKKTSKIKAASPLPQTETLQKDILGTQIICTKSNLSINLSLVSHTVPNRPTHPVLANVLLVADQQTQQVHLTTFDLNLGITTSFDAIVRSGGRLTLPVSLLSDIVAHLPEGDITLRQMQKPADFPSESAEENLIATLTSSSGRYQVRGMNAEEFPPVPTPSADQVIHLSPEALKEGISSSLFAASTDETKQILTGIHLKVYPDYLEFGSTDGHRLAIIQTSRSASQKKATSADETPLTFTVPAKSLSWLTDKTRRRGRLNPCARAVLAYCESYHT